jgi:DNA processing protein
MNNTLSRDSLAIILICSSLGMDIKNETIKPYTIKQWNELSNKLLNSEMKRPAAFFETDEQEWKNYLLMNDDDAMKLKKLLSRAGQVGIELEYLNSTGIYVTTRAEKNYPNRLKKILKKNSPPVIFYCGNIDITQSDGVAVVGSRKIDEKALEFTKTLVTKCTAQGFTIVSGGARGVDTAAQNAALLSGGKVISVVADSLLQRIKRKDVREAIMSGNLLLVTPSNPKNGFTVYSAMDRNKYIYALSKYAVVVSSDNNKGGTWTGAVENLKNKWVPLFVRKDDMEAVTWIKQQ